MQNYENFCVYANEFSSAAVWGNLTRISTDWMCDFPRISTDFWAAVSLSLTDFTDFGGKVFHGLSVRWNYLCYLCNLCEILGVGV